MFELYYKADADNSTNTRLMCDISDKDNNFVVEFLQFERSDFNKWGKSKVLTDLFITKFHMPEIYSHITSKEKMKRYIKNNIDNDFSIIEKFEELSTSKQRIVISLPTSMYPTRRGFPSSARAVKNTQLPLIVKIDDKDVSHAFIDFGDFEEQAVQTAYQALVKGKMPESKNVIFYSEGVESLHKELSNNEMEN